MFQVFKINSEKNTLPVVKQLGKKLFQKSDVEKAVVFYISKKIILKFHRQNFSHKPKLQIN